MLIDNYSLSNHIMGNLLVIHYFLHLLNRHDHANDQKTGHSILLYIVQP